MFVKAVLLLVMSAVAGGTGFARADTVWNKQGVAIEGEVISDEPGEPIVFRCMHKGEWKTFVFGRDEIKTYAIAAGDQSDGLRDMGRASAEAKPKERAQGDAADSDEPPVRKTFKGMLHCKELLPLLAEVIPSIEPQAEVILVRLSGPFEPANINRIGEAISFGVLDALMDFSTQRKPLAIVLKIDSGGGRVDQMDLIVEKLLEVQGPPDNHRVVAWVNMGGSAAALTALACKEIVMMPNGRLGAATRTYSNGEAVEASVTAGEKKWEAMRDARRRQIASLTKRSLAIQDAMEKPEHQFWHHPVLGFSLEEQDDSEWESYDTDDDKPLALDAQSVVDLGIAVGLAKNVDSLLSLIKVPRGTRVTEIDLASPTIQERLGPAREYAQAGNLAVEKFITRIKKEIDEAHLAIRATAGIRLATDGYTNADLAAFRTALAKCQAPRLDAKTRDYLKKTSPEQLVFCEEKLQQAQRVFDRAKQSASDAGRSGAIAIGPIVADLEYAIENLIEVGVQWQ